MMTGCNYIDTLPLEMLSKIFLGLPAKSLLVCKAVCKEFYGVISSPSFIKDHLNKNHQRLILYMNRTYVPSEKMSSYYSYFPDESLSMISWCKLPDHLILLGEITYLRGPCNGIYCIYVADNRFALWNPTTRRVRLIRCSPSHKFNEMGFGIDPVTGDFKIVLIHSDIDVNTLYSEEYHDNNPTGRIAAGHIFPWFAVYTSSSDSWKYMEQQEFLADSNALIMTYLSVANTFLNGFYYWIKHKLLYANGEMRHHSSILAFDMHNETFQEINNIPADMAGVGIASQLHVFNDDSLAIVSFKECMEIWVMKAGQQHWTKFLSAVLSTKVLISYGFWGRNKILVAPEKMSTSYLRVYDLHSHREAELIRHQADNYYCPGLLPICYKESLLPLKGQHGTPDYDTRSVECLEFLGYHSHSPNTKLNCFEFTYIKIMYGRVMFG